MSLTPEQIEARRSLIGASEAGAALGLSRYRGPWQVWACKVGLRPGFSGNWDTSRGDALEPLILGWYARQTGAFLSVPGTIPHRSIPCVGATPDSLASKDGRQWLVEAKAPSGRTRQFWGEPGTDEIDLEYCPQAVVQMAVFDLDFVDVAASIAGEEPLVYRVHRQKDLETLLLSRLESWWKRHVEGREPPSADGSEELRAWLEDRYGRHDGLMLDATPTIERWGRQLGRVRAKQDHLERARSRLENQFRAVIADAEGVRGEFGSVTWRRSKKTGRRSLRFHSQE